MKKKQIKKQLTHASVTVISILVVAAIAIVLNIVLGVLDNSLDLSASFSHTNATELSSISKNVLDKLEASVEIIVLGNEDDFKNATYEESSDGEETVYSPFRYTYELLDMYRKTNDKISVYYVQSRYNPAFFTERGITATDGTYIIVYCPETKCSAKIEDDIFGESEYIGLDRRVASGINSVTKDDIKTVGIITGHSEKTALYLESLLTLNAYNVVSFDLAAVDAIAEDIDIAVIVSPSVSYGAEDIKKLRRFLDNGGSLGKSLVVFADTEMPENSYLEDFLATEWGLALSDYAVFDPANSRTVLDVYEPVIKLAYDENSVANEIHGDLLNESNSLYSTLGTTRAVNILFEGKDSVRTCPLLTTVSDNAFGKNYKENTISTSDFKSMTRADGDIYGRITVGAMAYAGSSVTTDEAYTAKYSSVCLYGTTAFTETFYISNLSGSTSATTQYMLNTFAYLSHDVTAIKIYPDSIVTGTITFDNDVVSMTVCCLSIATIPVLCAVVGITVWRKRRYL